MHAHKRVWSWQFFRYLGLNFFGVFRIRKLKEKQTILVHRCHVSFDVHVHEKYCVYKVNCWRNSSSLSKISCSQKRVIFGRTYYFSLDDLLIIENLKSKHSGFTIKLVWRVFENQSSSLYVKKTRKKAIKFCWIKIKISSKKDRSNFFLNFSLLNSNKQMQNILKFIKNTQNPYQFTK